MTEPATISQAKLKVFVSYSRQDMDFADRLVDALERRGFEVLIDRRNLPALEDWERELVRFIRQADTVVFVVSPASVASKVCSWEVDQVRRLAKRLAPVVIADVMDYAVPAEIARINYLFVKSDAPFELRMDELATALRTDLQWLKEHTRIGDLALRWLERGRPADALLRGQEIVDADGWAANRPREAPVVAEHHLAYLSASRAREAEDRERERAQIARTRRFQRRSAWTLTGFFVLVLALLVGTLWQQRETERREASAFASSAAAALRNEQYPSAMRLALQAFPPLGAAPWSLGTDDRALRALEADLAGGALMTMAARTFGGHAGWVTSATFSHDGRKIITASQDGIARVWDTASGRPTAQFDRHGKAVVMALISPDSSFAASIGEDRTLRLWDPANGREMWALDVAPDLTWAVAISPDGKSVALAGIDSIRVFDVASRREIAVMRGHRASQQLNWLGIAGVAFSADGRRLVTSSHDHTARVWDAVTGAQIAAYEGHKSFVLCAAFSPDGTRVASTSVDTVVWEATTGQALFQLKGTARGGGNGCARFSPDGKLIVTLGSDSRAHVWDAETGREIVALAGHELPLNAAAFSPDGSRIVTVSDDRTARVWDSRSGREISVLKGHAGKIRGAAFGPGGTQVLTYSEDGTARLWTLASQNGDGRELAIIGTDKRAVETAVFDRRGTYVLTASDRTARKWDARTGQPLEHAVYGDLDPDSFSARFSADSKLAITTHRDRTSRVWDVETGRELAALRTGIALDAMMSADASLVLTASLDGMARLWSRQDGSARGVLAGHTGPVTSAAFDFNDRRIVTAGADATARLWDARTLGELFRLEGHRGSVLSAAFGSDGKQVVTGGEDATVRLWNAETGTQTGALIGHRGPVIKAAFDRSGVLVLSASTDNTVRLWDVVSAKEVDQIGFDPTSTPRISSVALSPDGRQLAAALIYDRIVIRDVAGRRERGRLELESGIARALEYSADGKLIIAALEDGSGRIWDAESLALVHRLEAMPLAKPQTRILGAVISPDDKHIATISAEQLMSTDHEVRIWDAKTGAMIAAIEPRGGTIAQVAFDPTGRRLITAQQNRLAIVWDVTSGAELLRLEGHSDSVTAVTFSGDGRLIGTASDDDGARLWDAATGRPVMRLDGHGQGVTAIAFSPDGLIVATGSDDHTARLWNAATGTPTAVLRGHGSRVTSVGFSPDGRMLATASDDGSVRIWDGASGASISHLVGHTGPVRTAAFSPNGMRVLTASRDRTVRLFDAQTGQNMAVFRGHTDEVTSAWFSPGGDRIVTSSRDGTARIWDVSIGTLLRGAELRELVCREKLQGQQEFTAEELQDPVLLAVDHGEPRARNPCLRRGPLAVDYWIGLPRRVIDAVRSLVHAGQ